MSRSLRGGSAEQDRQLHSTRRRTRGTGCCPGTNTGGCGPGVGVALSQEQRESKHSEVRGHIVPMFITASTCYP